MIIDYDNDFLQIQTSITEDTHAWGYILKSAIVAVVPAPSGSDIVLATGDHIHVIQPPRKVMLKLAGADEGVE